MPKKIIATLLLLVLVAQVWAFTYPETLYGLFQKYRDLQTTLHVITINIVLQRSDPGWASSLYPFSKSYVGKVLVAGSDYLTFKTTDGDVIIIPYTAIVEVSEE